MRYVYGFNYFHLILVSEWLGHQQSRVSPAKLKWSRAPFQFINKSWNIHNLYFLTIAYWGQLLNKIHLLVTRHFPNFSVLIICRAFYGFDQVLYFLIEKALKRDADLVLWDYFNVQSLVSTSSWLCCCWFIFTDRLVAVHDLVFQCNLLLLASLSVLVPKFFSNNYVGWIVANLIILRYTL